MREEELDLIVAELAQFRAQNKVYSNMLGISTVNGSVYALTLPWAEFLRKVCYSQRGILVEVLGFDEAL